MSQNDLKIRLFRPDGYVQTPSLLLGTNQRATFSVPPHIPAESVWKMINNILKEAQNGQISVEFLQFTFFGKQDFYEAELCDLSILERTSHLIWYKFLQFRSPLKKIVKRHVDFQLFPLILGGVSKSALIKIEREKTVPAGKCRITVTLARIFGNNRNPRLEALNLIVDDLYSNGLVKDLSLIYAQMQEIRYPRDLAWIIRKNYGQILAIKRWKYRRSVLNVLHEMVTSFWNGPSWILELKKEEYVQKRRNLWWDLAKVVYQEVLCPISQYCTFLP